MYFSYIQEHGFTALIVASQNGQTKVAGVLITRRAALDYQDKVRHHCGLEEWYNHCMGDISMAPVHTGSMLCIHYSNTSMVQQSSSPMYSVHAHYRL